MKKTLLLLFSLLALNNYAQDVLMQNGSINSCSGTFYDSGGELGLYGSNENLIFTICPENIGERTNLNFQEFSTELSDWLTIYDGDSTESPSLGSFSGTNIPGTVFATFDNPTGCLTFEFTSNSDVTSSGWIANIACIEPCQEITAQLDSTVPAANSDGIIEVCLGTPITFNGSGIFENSGLGATYTWTLGNGNTANGTSVTVTYDTPGIYLVNLNIRDTDTNNFAGGCPSTNTINQIVRVSGPPDFSGIQAEDDTLCFGETTTIEGIVAPLTLTYNCPPPETEETFLPDGSGAAYNTCINVTCFSPDAVLTDISQIFDICLNMEHSYSGDLDITIISPNGQEVQLFEQAGGNIYFGGANDDNSNDPGTGADYCFSMNASVLLQDAPTIIAGTNPPNNSWQPDTYLPVESFDQLLGSPLNGEWCIQIIDNLAIDNGYIFSWELNFDESVPQEDFEFVPTITSQTWDPDPSITEVNGNTITVAPETGGDYCYTFRTTDIFGCEYSEEVCISMAEENQAQNTFYLDYDGDGYGDPDNFIIECLENPPLGYVTNGMDCEDLNADFSPDAQDDYGNGIDENCDGADGVVLSINEFNYESASIHPNPFQSSFTVNLPLSSNGTQIEIKMFDLNGRLVYNKKHTTVDNMITIDNLNNLSNQIYFVELSNKTMGLSVIKKIVKM